jgi:preprotein translocase subunit SecA
LFFLSLEDDLMRIFASERIQKMMEFLGMKEGEQIEHRMLTRSIEGAQKKVEAHNFDIRKSLLEYDDVMNQQRRSIYRLRRMVLGFGAGIPVVEYDEDAKTRKKTRREKIYGWEDAREHVLDMSEDLILDMVGEHCPDRMSQWDLGALAFRVKDQFAADMKFGQPSSSRAREAREAAAEQIFKVVEKAYRCCAATSSTCTCRPSTPCGRTTCSPWTTCGRASGCAATASAIPSRSTSAKATTCSCG